MSTPEFVLALRAKIGTDPLWLSGVTAVVFGEDDRVLLVRRSDTGAWTPVTGIIDPGEEPAVAAEREVLEEADIHAIAEQLVWLHALPPMVYGNGDNAQYLDIVFRCRAERGDPYPADGENTDAAWFPVDALPEMSAEMTERVRVARDAVPGAAALFGH